MYRGPLRFTLFPYTTLFRSRTQAGKPRRRVAQRALVGTPVRPCPPEGGGTPQSQSAWPVRVGPGGSRRSEEHTSELQSRLHLVCRLLLEKKNLCYNKFD